MTELRITGADQLDQLATRLKETGRKDLRKELLRGFRESGRPVLKSVRESARTELPQSGGLAAQVASQKFSTRPRLGGKNVGVTFQEAGMKGLRRMDAGTVRHPVFGTDTWVTQSIRPGFFTKPIEHDIPTIREHLLSVMEQVAARIERSV